MVLLLKELPSRDHTTLLQFRYILGADSILFALLEIKICKKITDNRNILKFSHIRAQMTVVEQQSLPITFEEFT